MVIWFCQKLLAVKNMDIKLLKSIVNLFEGSSLSELSVEDNENGANFKVNLKKGTEGVPVYATNFAAVPASANNMPAPTAVKNSEGAVDFNNLSDIKSPMVGVFYQSSSPDSPVFVSKGAKVSKGDTLCIIEAMKLMNEIVADRDGEIVEVVAKNGDLVEFGQVLFRIL